MERNLEELWCIEIMVLDNLNQTTQLLFSSFPQNTTILPTFGNHDYAPANGFISDSNLYQNTWEIWKSKIGPENHDTFMSGGYYKYRLKNATALVLNTNLYYNANKAYANFTDKDDPAGQFAFLENELKNAETCPNRVNTDCTSIVHIIAHIGPGVFERTYNFTWFRPEYNERFLNITVRYANSIGWMLFGHHHTDTFHLIKDSKENVVQAALMAPAVTPWFSSLDGAGANNPTFRVYDTDAYNNILDIQTYYINLDDLNKNASTPFVFEYSFKDAYGIQGYINANSLSKVVESIKNNDTVFQKYINFNSAFWKPEMPTGIYRGAQLCSLEYSDYPRYYSCLAQYSKRIIVCGEGICYISIGPCSLHSARFCFVVFIVTLHFYTHSIWLLFISFSYRYYVMVQSEPSMWRTQLVIALLYIPSIFQIANVFTQNVPEDVAKKMVLEYFPSYDLSQLTVTAVSSVWDFTVLYCTVHIVGVSIPIAFGIIALRNRIIAKIRETGLATSERSKQLQLQVLRALTFQACIPVFYLWGGLCFMIQQWNLVNNALPQYFMFCLFILVPILNPISSFIFITPYRAFFVLCAKRKVSGTSRNISIYQSTASV
ncbi:unnamed protein product [Caenorhabditis angaria]|uniref:Sphingomyelin phosphodiesterase C-terminal domain-containing protein n=1 Tax=Caenorhabditis angaria TaxID=860376 RepID=A0A9P1IRB9_9PELO|nr:unnamed protein product [Caenorhabditis angaria]